MVYYDNIPEELKKLDQWVCANDGSKVPMKAWENEAASSTNPETWSDFETALESYNQHYYDYCGFVFADNGYVGIDIDEGYDEDGLMSVLGADIVGKCHSYTEKSRSGRGFHMAKIYVALIRKGLKTINDVPEQLREEVKKLLEE